jgi:hypothetical protein
MYEIEGALISYSLYPYVFIIIATAQLYKG